MVVMLVTARRKMLALRALQAARNQVDHVPLGTSYKPRRKGALGCLMTR